MTDEQIKALEITLGLILDAGAADEDGLNDSQRHAIGAIGDLLGSAGGLALMSTVMEAVLRDRDDPEGKLEAWIDHGWHGIEGWAS